MPKLDLRADPQALASAPTNSIARAMPLRWRAFAREYAKHRNTKTAWIKASPSANPNHAYAHANRVLRKPIVREYLARLQARQDEAAFLSIEDKREYLAEAVYASVSQLTPDSPLVQEVVETTKEGKDGSVETVRKIKMISKTKAIELDNQLAGHVQNHKIDVGIDIAGVSAALGAGTAFIPELADTQDATEAPALDVEVKRLEDCRSDGSE